jgi:hypothetical protein
LQNMPVLKLENKERDKEEAEPTKKGRRKN